MDARVAVKMKVARTYEAENDKDMRRALGFIVPCNGGIFDGCFIGCTSLGQTMWVSSSWVAKLVLEATHQVKSNKDACDEDALELNVGSLAVLYGRLLRYEIRTLESTSITSLRRY